MKTILYFFTILSLLNCSKDKSVSADLAMIAEPMIAAKSANYNATPPLAEIKLVDSAALSVNESSPNSLKPTNQNGISKKIIKNGNMMIDVGDIKSEQEKIQKERQQIELLLLKDLKSRIKSNVSALEVLQAVQSIATFTYGK